MPLLGQQCSRITFKVSLGCMAERSPHSSALQHTLLAGDSNGSFTSAGTHTLRRLPPLAQEVAEGLARQEAARWQASGSRRELASQQTTTFEFTISTSTLITQHSRIQQLQPENVSQAAFQLHQVTNRASDANAQHQRPQWCLSNQFFQVSQKMQPARGRLGHHTGVSQQHAAEAHGSMPDFENPTKLGDLVAGSDSAKRPPPMKKVRLPWLCENRRTCWTSRACSETSSVQARNRARLARAQAQAKAQAQVTPRRAVRHYSPEHLARSQVSALYAGSVPVPVRQLSLLCSATHGGTVVSACSGSAGNGRALCAAV